MLTRLRLPMALFGLVVVGGVLGYRWLEGWTWLESAWMVGITLTTIGFGEIHPLSDQGRVFTLALILGGISIASYLATEVTRYVVEGDLRRELAARRWRKLMDGMRDHFIVVGYGRLGREVALELRHSGAPVLVIEPAIPIADQAEREGFPVLRGDASQDSALRSAHVERARGIAIATSSNAENVFITLSARHLAPAVLILVRVDDEETASKARRAGADHVLSPRNLGGAHMAHALLRPHARAFLDLALSREYRDLEFGEVLYRGPGRELRALEPHQRHQVLVVAIQRLDGSMVPVPGPDQALEEGDVMILVGHPDRVRAFSRAMG